MAGMVTPSQDSSTLTAVASVLIACKHPSGLTGARVVTFVKQTGNYIAHEWQGHRS